MKSFEEFRVRWLRETNKIKIKKDLKSFVFIIVYPTKLVWDFASEKQLQTTLLQTSGGITGAGTGHAQKICHQKELYETLETCENYTHAMIVSVGMVFNMVRSRTAIQQFYDWSKTEEFCKGHIIARPNEGAFIHHQHIQLNLKKWRYLNKPNILKRQHSYKRANDNFHDDYTPSWITFDGLPTITNFSKEERGDKAWSYGHMEDRRKLQNKNWEIIDSKVFGWRDKIDKSDPYFNILFTRMYEVFYAENTESIGKLPDKEFDLILTPTAGYSGEVFADRLNFNGEIVFYDYCSENIKIKKNIVDMNMSRDDILLYAKTSNHIIAMNSITPNKEQIDMLNERTKSFGAFEELRFLQEKMYNTYDIKYKVWDIICGINIESDWLIEKIKSKKVFMDISNIYGYHTSHLCYSFSYLLESFDKLIHTLEKHTDYYYLKGTRPTKDKYING